MSYQPVLPFGGVSGWSFLNRTRESQQQAFNASFVIQRDVDYFRDNIAGVKTAEALVSDRRLLSVALGAFGLDDDIANKFFIQKILDDGTLREDALANRLSDRRYQAMSKAFGFGDFSVPNTQLSEFPDKIISAYQDRQFEIAVGNQDEDLRLALSVERDLGDILAKDTTDNGFWYNVMGNPPLRRVFETAMGLPAAVASLGLEQQLGIFRDKAERVFGGTEVAQFGDPETREKLVRLFLVRSEGGVGGSGLSPGAAALTLLQGANFATPLL